MLSIKTKLKVSWALARYRPRWPIAFLRGLLCGWSAGAESRCYRFFRWLEGARSVRTASFEKTSGEYENSRGDYVEFGGACPVQGDGFVNGRPCYYRSRGEGWQFVAASAEGDALDDDAWCYQETPYYWPDGGWAHYSVSQRCIARAIAAYRRETDGGKT